MEKTIAVLCIMVLSVTAVDGVVEYSGVDLPGFTDPTQQNGEGDWSTIESATVPDNKIREIVHYDHTIKIELYFENKTSGEWTYWALDVSGNELILIPGTSIMPDGYGEEHNVMHLRRELSAQFTVYLDDSEGEQITSDGEYDVQRDEYTDLNSDYMEQKVVRIDTSANISVDELPSTNIPLAFSGFMRSYFDPHLPKLETLEDDIYGEGQTVTVGDTGSWTDETSWNDVNYDWVAEKGRIMSGYETVLINVSTDFAEDDDDWSLPFKELIWISNEVSMPVKQFIRTNTSWDGEEEAGYILLENTFELRENGYTEGTSDIPWGKCTSFHWLQEHPMGDTETWKGNYMPKSGDGWEESSFHWKPEDAVDWLEKNMQNEAPELDDYLSNNPQAIIVDAQYNASIDYEDEQDPEGLAGEFWWNFTFGFERKSSQTGSSWDLENRYNILIHNNTEWEPGDILDPVKHTISRDVELDMGRQGGTAPIGPDDIATRTITMASSEKIFKTDDKAVENFYTTPAGLPMETLDWGDGDATQYSLSASSGQQGFGMDLIATLTGIQTQTWAKYSWTVYKDDLMQGGTLTTASLDAETGRMISLMEIEGTSLENAFISGD